MRNVVVLAPLLMYTVVSLAAESSAADDPFAGWESPKLAMPIVYVPEANVPKECAEFSGGWGAKWTYGGFENWLWVTKVTADCIATVGYSRMGVVPSKYIETTIENGKLTFLCDPSRGGTCTLTRVMGSLWANYSNPSGGRNSATFRPISNPK